MKLTINKLIANDIINYGMDNTTGLNYVVYLDEYLKDYDEETQKYILEHLEEIENDIEQNENVADLEITEDEDGKSYDMCFYWENLLTQIEKFIYDNANILNKDLDFEDIRSISESIVDDDPFNDELANKIINYDNGKDID